MPNIISLQTIKETLNAQIIVADSGLDDMIEHVYASDLMSDLLAFGKPNSILLTGLATKQAVISAHMAEFKGVVFVRGKLPKDNADKYARDKKIVLLSTQFDMYESCVRIYAAMSPGVLPTSATIEEQPPEHTLLSQDFHIQGRDFSNAGNVSTEIKEILKKIGIDSQISRRVAISTYEGELNVIMHANQGTARLIVSPTAIEVIIKDQGPGIPDIEMAMQEGFTTASEEMRAMGFGSGMGLPNINKNTDELRIESKINDGTTVYMKFNIEK